MSVNLLRILSISKKKRCGDTTVMLTHNWTASIYGFIKKEFNSFAELEYCSKKCNAISIPLMRTQIRLLVS